ncbi:alpha/beta hydrolase [Streptomyces albireticuli]|uniref:DUF1023 domain-containing protein n=1 Tax=Streptomyces albireticuli TaxID=1940 RepID=A0A2A2D2C6_9ACTN|nr:alpha/beta hydrolase [Streptomyces albireticuli]MCD9141433.1 alpha/beta hydrolase family protein [Streptomyces albireticuli]MCD9160606.1 alpha/beta hydrolase family protein [Streptomyces albireticuli]MCD9195838.1 alpha/beta hydrolase family protein [Streptomyces albireticuli]PAU45675.1 hypothetical protein CK936_28220 [Streptomyces albireticuli]
MDYAALKAFKKSQYTDAADSYRTTGDMADQAKAGIENQITASMRKTLRGEAADAALFQLRELAKNFHYVQVECGLVSTALNAFASDVEAARTKLDRAVEDAESRKFTVGADGSVSYPEGGEKTDGKTPKGGTANGTTDATARAINRQAANFDPNPNFAPAQECADRIAEALKEATVADEKWAPKLRSLRADDDLTVSSSDWVDAQEDMGRVRDGAKSYLDHIKAPPKGGDPEANADWWKKLSEREKSAYLAVHPASVGALNGLPAAVRDEANRTVLDEKKAEYRQRLKAIPEEPERFTVFRDSVKPNADWVKWNSKYGDEREQLREALKGMDAIQDRLDSTGGKTNVPEAYLLAFHPEKDGRVVLANGNPDTADHTAVYVPGTKTHLGSIEGDLNRGVKLWRASDSLAASSKVSTITWFDYDAPNLLGNATSDGYAEKGGPDLREFLDGNKAAHQSATGSTAHTTIIGHSYGSTVIGDGAKSGHWPDGPLAVDDVIAAGSPGMQARRAADLGIKPGHMWAEKADNYDDWFVREGGRNVGLGGDRVIPTDKEFGAQVMKSDAPDHGGYWNMDDDGNASVSLQNQARVIVGEYKEVTLE